MTGKFSMDDYVDVNERIQMFTRKYPDGCLRSELTRMADGWLCRAEAWRTPEDPAPAVGHAFEPVPGKTPYTRDSEAMNAETSAWGRAIVALGFETKKIASADEIRNRQEPPAPPAPSGQGASVPAADAPPPEPTVFVTPPKARSQETQKLIDSINVTIEFIITNGWLGEAKIHESIQRDFGKPWPNLTKAQCQILLERLTKYVDTMTSQGELPVVS